MAFTPTFKLATIVVAPVNSGYTADYYTDGVADDVQIQAAITALPAGGGRVVLCEGTYNISVTITIPNSNTILEGAGNATILKAISGLNSDVLLISHGGSGNVQSTVVKNLLIDGRRANNTSGHGINTLGAILCYFDHLTVQNVKQVGINLVGNGSQDSYWNHITETLIQNSGQWIVETHSHENYIYSCDMNNHGSRLPCAGWCARTSASPSR